ncbi:3868_t:CDS:1, partial [Scutellospora calospora]
MDKHLAFKSMLQGNLSLFINRILKYHKSKSLLDFKSYNELAFKTAIELLLPIKHRISEMCLMIDGHSGFIDIFINGIIKDKMQSSVILELKCISLLGLLSGEKGEWVENMNFQTLKKLDEEIENETEDKLLERKYFYYSKDDKIYKQVTVKEIIDNGIEQLKRYIKTMQKGK